ncbi:hypothetical protein [Bacillus sp. JJ722]|uniref:hypothetical protein n=1 Tax=Bacillus sp. JJ722 TaxID=3122973 RepID=UPI002FFEAB1F
MLPIRYFTGILYVVAGLLFLLLYYSNSFREEVSQRGIPTENYDQARLIGFIFIILGIILIIFKAYRKRKLNATNK